MNKAGIHGRVRRSSEHAAGRTSAWRVLKALAPLLALALAAPAHSAVDPAALQDDPCLILPAQLVSEVFGVPEDEMEQTGLSMASHLMCDISASDDDNELSVHLTTQLFDDSAGAGPYFASATRSMSTQEMADAAGKLKSGAVRSGSHEEAANPLVDALTRSPLTFDDVNDVGDEARFNEMDGTLTVRQGNLILAIRAYHGPGMPMPDDMSQFVEAAEQWQKDTTAERKQAAVRLASALVDSLK